MSQTNRLQPHSLTGRQGSGTGVGINRKDIIVAQTRTWDSWPALQALVLSIRAGSRHGLLRGPSMSHQLIPEHVGIYILSRSLAAMPPRALYYYCERV